MQIDVARQMNRASKPLTWRNEHAPATSTGACINRRRNRVCAIRIFEGTMIANVHHEIRERRWENLGHLEQPGYRVLRRPAAVAAHTTHDSAGSRACHPTLRFAQQTH